MDYIKLRARAKINLSLDVTGRREDGYHELRMVMQTINLCDEVYLKKIKKDKISLKSNLRWLPRDERNLAYKAAMLMTKEYHLREGVFIELDKRIPVAAGLAGGSSDCAAVLVGMNRLFDLGLSKKELMQLGLRLGTDIPFCIVRGTALAEGVGEKLTKLPSCPFYYVLLVKPPVSVSTAFVYQHLDLNEVLSHPDTDGMLKALEESDSAGIAERLHNVLEEVTVPMYPEIASIKREMLLCGAEGALMSGSGPTVFGLFEKEQDAVSAMKKMKNELKYKDVFLTTVFKNNRTKGDNKNVRL